MKEASIFLRGVPLWGEASTTLPPTDMATERGSLQKGKSSSRYLPTGAMLVGGRAVRG